MENDDRRRGRVLPWTFVLFGDTQCAEPCTRALSALTGMCERIAGRSCRRPRSLDPEGVVWGQFLPPFDVMQLTAPYLKARLRR